MDDSFQWLISAGYPVRRIRKFWYFMSDFFFVTSWQFYVFPVVDISWTTQPSLIQNLCLHTVLLCSLSSGICSLPVKKLFTSGLNFLTSGRKSLWTNKSLICLFCYWRHIMQIKSVNNILGVICCPELTASCVSAASEMELNLERQTLLNQQRLETII